MNFQSGVPWHQLLLTSGKGSAQQSMSRQEINRLLQKSSKIYEEYVQSQEDDDELTKEIMESGTRKDKFSAIKVSVQETPLLSLKHLKELNEQMSSKPRTAIEAMQNAVQIYTKYLLPSRPLKSFEDQPLKTAKDSGLCIFYFEDQLKRTYSEFIKNVEIMAKAHQQFIREPAIRALGELLRSAPENEQVLLAILVDKFGDPLKQVSVVATSTILSVLKDHPQMTQAVVNAIKVQQPKFTEESQKRTMKFIGQLTLGKKDTDTARDLLETVKPQLIEVLTSNDPSNSKVLSSLMRSAEKCATVCSPKDMDSLIKPLYDFVQTAPLTSSLPALKLLFTIHKLSGKIPIEFYNFLYSALLASDFTGSSKHPQLLNFLMESLSSETDNNIICNFVHRLLQVGLEMNITFATAVLVFVMKLFEKKPEIWSIFKSENPEVEKTYDFNSTNLQSAAARETFPWILSLYVKHYHPAIQTLAKTLVSQNNIEYTGDVFDDFATTKQLYRITHGGTQATESDLFNNCFKEFDEIPDFPDEEDFEIKDEPKPQNKQNKQSKQNKSNKPHKQNNKNPKNQNKKGNKNDKKRRGKRGNQ
ncbi:hypothetical protein TRFO_01853 [Tritrichomonas foetus]|uniref:CCAAT-binding factor domain-containing protein n=1 Tax=Tritrichomonas foetus TaxID=1144522 RepID=A0A1J4JI01_9EUKA|nr:hypothetical protein TRFO_01853 [Tritrichomonas foetus]|eukprot:OHS98800.1 hypothetical protein TRFO_01853 [Tritrichomonas foetus]